MAQLIPTALLAIGCLLVLLFLFWPLFGGPPGPTDRIPRWVFLTDGAGIILWSRAFAAEPTQPALFGAGAVLLTAGAFINWRFIIARRRSRAVAGAEQSAGHNSGAPL